MSIDRNHQKPTRRLPGCGPPWYVERHGTYVAVLIVTDTDNLEALVTNDARIEIHRLLVIIAPDPVVLAERSQQIIAAADRNGLRIVAAHGHHQTLLDYIAQRTTPC